MDMNGNIAARCRTVYALTVFLIVSALTPYIAYASETSPQRALLCTSMGYQWIDITDQDTGRINTNSPCIYCLLSSVDDLDGLLNITYKTSPPEGLSLTPHQVQTELVSAASLLTTHPRAPPVIL